MDVASPLLPDVGEIPVPPKPPDVGMLVLRSDELLLLDVNVHVPVLGS